jgi:mxaJ protein
MKTSGTAGGLVFQWILVATATVALPAQASARPILRVCADPNNLPFSNQAEEGFENKIASRLAAVMGADLQYIWWPQRRGFVRNTLATGACDVIVGVPASFPAVAHTRPYYRSTYVFATRTGRRPIRSFDDPALRRLRIGIALIGDDGANPPPELALARRGLIDNVVGYGVYGDYARPDPPLELVQAVVSGDIDVAAVWGPLAGYLQRKRRLPLILWPVAPGRDADLPFAFDITMGVRPGPADQDLRQRLDVALREQHDVIERILDEYGVPRG